MSVADKRAKIERGNTRGEAVSVRRQCELLDLARSGVYRVKAPTPDDDLALMRRIDELHLDLPFHGSRRMTFALNAEGLAVALRVWSMSVMGPANDMPNVPLDYAPSLRARPCRATRRSAWFFLLIAVDSSS